MRKLLTNFVDSAKEFTNLRSLITAALLVALKTILTVFVSIQVTDSVRISISFVCSVIIGAFYGPVMGFVTGGLSDIIQFLIKPTGAFNPGLTLNACLAGFIYGLFFYGKFPKKIPSKEAGNEFSKTLKRGLQIFLNIDIPFLLLCTLAMIVDAFCVNIFLGTFWISKMIGTNYWVLFVPRMIKNLVQLPINIILSYYVLYFAKTAIKKN